MPKEITYNTKQVTEALTLLAVNAGNFARTAEELRDRDEDPIEIRASTLRTWAKDTHVEQYRRLQEDVGVEMEAQATQRARKLMAQADEKLEALLERAGDAKDEDVPQALRAVADVKSKSGNLLMQLTGRPVNPRDNSAGDIVDLIKHMVDRGYMNLAPDVQASVEGSALDDD